ncbi:hypothetical protein D3C87_1474330 [compost metagenome]
MQRRQQDSKLIAAQTRHQILFAQLRTHPRGHRHQHRIASGMAEVVVEHHCGFDGVVDRARNQVQVVVGIDPQRQNPEQRQRDAGHGHADQRDDQMTATDDRTQGWARIRFE